MHSDIRQLQLGATRHPAMSFAQAQASISQHQAELAEHPFFEHLNEHGSFEDIRAIAPRVAFFVMCFQDVIRLVPRLTTDPTLQNIGRVHEREDKGHDRWFLQDLERFGVACDVGTLFSDEHSTVRDIVYEQIADVLRAKSDWARLGLVLALEAAGTEFFGTIIELLERTGRAQGLKYFARSHQHVEQSHEIHAESSESLLAALTLSPEALAEVLTVIDRTFMTMSRLADDLHSHATSMQQTVARSA
jgi:hypothetical protein